MARRQAEELEALLERFVRVRLVRAWGLDLDLFQFDTDATWMAFFLNADRAIYGRYGTREAGDFTLEGFAAAARGALELHADYPANRESLARKTGPKSAWAAPQEIPALAGRFREGDDSDHGCIHCHTAHEGRLASAWRAGESIPDSLLWKYPEPALLGFDLDARDPAAVSRVRAGSPAAAAGLQTGDRLLRAASQPLISKADLQWALQQAADGGEIRLEVRRGEAVREIALPLAPGWRRAGRFVRPNTTWMAQTAVPGFVVQPLSDGERRKSGAAPDRLALSVRYAAGSRETDAEPWESNRAPLRAGLKSGDVVVEIDGRDDPMTIDAFVAFFYQEKKPGDRVRLGILRGGERRTIEYRLPER